MSGTLGVVPPVRLESLAGPTPNAATTPPGFWDSTLQAATSALRSGTSELVGLPGEWVQGLTGVSPAENDAWRDRNFWTGLLTQLVGGVPAYLASAAVTGPMVAAPAVARVAPWAARAFTAEQMAAAPVRALATQGVLSTVPISAARLGLTPLLGGDLERTAASVGIDLAGSAVMGAGFGLFRGLRGHAAPDDYERLLAQQLPEYSAAAPVQERLSTLLDNRATLQGELGTLADRTLEGLRRQVRLENSPSLTGERGWLGPLEGEENFTKEASRNLRMDLGRLFRPTGAELREDGRPRGLSVQTFSQTKNGFADAASWRAALDEVGLPADWERNVQFPRLVTAHGNEFARVSANIERHLGQQVGDGWHIAREANQDLFVVAKRLQDGPSFEGRWFVARTNAPEKLLPMAGSLRRGDKLARFVGQAEETALSRGAQALPEDDVLRQAEEMTRNRPPGLRAEKGNWQLAEHFPAPLRNAAKESQPLAEEIWRRFKSVAAPTQQRFKDRPLASWIVAQAKSIYENAQGKASRALHGPRPATSPGRQIMQGLPDQGGLRSQFDKLKNEDVALVQRYAHVRETGKLDLDAALAATFDDVDSATRLRVEPLIREWDKQAVAVWEELKRNAALTGTKLPREVESWALPHTWVGDWRQKINTDDGKLHVVGGRTKAEAQRNAENWIAENGGSLQPRGVFQTDRDGDYQLLGEIRAKNPASLRVGINPQNSRNLTPAGGYAVSPENTLTKTELWDIMSSDITMKYRDLATRTVDRLLAQGMLQEVRSKYGLASAQEVQQVLRTMKGEQGSFSRWQNQAMAPLDPLLGKNSASKIAAAWNATEAHLAFGFGNLMFPAGNAITFLQTVAPKLALTRDMLRRGQNERVWQLFDFQPSFAANGVPDGAYANISPLKLAKAAFSDMVNPSAEHLQMFNKAVEEGVVAARMRDEFLGQKSRIAQNVKEAMAGNEPVSNLLRAAGGVNMILPHRVEEMTRAHAFFTWLRVGETLGLTADSAYELAKRGTWSTMYGYAQADRPRMFTGPVGMMAGLFKNWMINYVADMARYSGEAMRGNFGGLLWALGTTTGLAGLGGLPLYGLVDAYSKMLGNAPLVEELYGAVDNTTTADALYYGLPGLLGVSLQGMMAAPANDPRRDITFLANAVALDRAQRVATAAGDLWNRWSSGGPNPLMEDRSWDQLVYALGPRTLYRGMAQVEDGALKSIRNGRPIIEGVSELERGLNVVGLTPTRIARAWEVSESLWQDQEKRRALTGRFGEAYAEAWKRGDAATMQDVLQRAVETGADLSSVMRGAMQRMQDATQPQIPFDYLRRPEAMQRLERMRVE